MGKYGEAVPLWEEVLCNPDRTAPPRKGPSARRRIGIIKSYQGDPQGALEEFERILSFPSGSLSPALLARTRLRRGIALEELGRLEEAGQELEEVLGEAEELDDPIILAQAHRALVLLHIWTGHPDRVRVHADRAMELARSSGAQSVEFWTHWGMAVLEGLLGNTDVMAEQVREAERVAQELRSPLLQLRSPELAIEHAAATGQWDSGIIIGEQAIALARGLSQNTLLPRVLVWTSLIYLARGEVELARPLVGGLGGVGGGGRGNPQCPRRHPRLHRHGLPGPGRGRLRRGHPVRPGGLEMADRVGYGLWAIHRLVPLLAEAYLWKGDLEGAREMGRRLRSGPPESGTVWAWPGPDSCDALVTWLEGDPEGGPS